MDSQIGIYIAAWAVAFFINLIISFFVANAAARKGKSWAAFFWLSFLFSWIVMAIIVAVLSPTAPATVGATRACPKCAEPVSVNAQLCKHCKSEIEPLPEQQSIETPSAPSNASNVMKILSFVFMGFGLLWIVIYYASSAQFPLGAATPLNLENWNIIIGFLIAMLGFAASYASKGKK